MAVKDSYYTITKAAKVANVTRQTVSRWIAEGRFPTEKIGRTRLIRKKTFDKFEASRIWFQVAGIAERKIMEIIREHYKLTDDDLIYPIPNPLEQAKDNVFYFMIDWASGLKDIARFELGESHYQPTKDSSEDSGTMQFEIKEISKSPVKK